MNIQIDLIISASPELLAALQLLTSGKTVAAIPAPAPENNGTEKKTRTKKTEYAPSGPATPEKIETEVVKEATETAVKEEIKTDLTQEMIIADAVPKSKAGHKDKIKAKVTELGYESITDLEPKHFDEFYAFLQTIPKPA